MALLTERQNERRYLWMIVTFLFFALCLFAVIHTLAPVCNSSVISERVAAGMERSAGPLDDALTAQATASSRHAAEAARAQSRVRLQFLLHHAAETLNLTKSLEQAQADWTTLTSAVLTDERGKKLATDANAVDAYRSLTQASRPERMLAEQVRERIATLVRPLQSALEDDDVAYVPSDDFVGLLERERELITSATASYTQARTYLEGLLTAAAQSTGTQTLADVIEQRVAQEARTQSMATAAARGEAIVEVRQQLASAEATKVREVGRTEAERIRSEEDAEKGRIDAEAIRIRQQGERQRQMKLAQDPDIQARFAPFLAPGRRYPARYEGSVRWLERKPWGRTAPRPVSLHELKTGGVLDNLESFVIAASSSKSKTGSQNDRPHWSMPVSPVEWDARRQDLELFQQLVPVWVDLGVLSPN